MAKNKDTSNGNGQTAWPTFTDADIANARKCFERGQELAEKKNYDYAIEVYISGLEYWPEAVEEGHKPCRAAALFRGSKKASFTDGMRYKTNAKDLKKAMLNAEMLLSKDPKNVGYMEAMFKNAAKGGYIAAAMWVGEMLAEAAIREAKPSPARFILMREVYEELGDRLTETNPLVAITAYERAVEALSRLQKLKPNDLALSTELRDVAGKLTIVKGKYSSADSFKDSIQDGEAQAELHDKERAYQSDERLDELIARAQVKYEAEPTIQPVIYALVDLLTRREQEKDENKAIGVLVKAFKATNEYRYKMRADDIRIRQLNRQARQIVAQGDAQAAKQHYREKMKFELAVFKDRARHYPTDLRIRFQYGTRLFKVGRFDDAIPVLQEARSDPKTRNQCSLYVGRCFFEKNYAAQAIDTFREALDGYETPDDELGKDLHYWLGRSYESDGKLDEALKIYGQLIQWDYNYRKGDVRKRVDRLREQREISNEK